MILCQAALLGSLFFLAASLKLSCVEYRKGARKQQGRTGKVKKTWKCGRVEK